MGAMSKKDVGLFGPESVTWKVQAEPSMLIGGLRSLLVQALNPLAMAGVDQHSNYKDDPWSRLMATSGFIVDTTYGDTPTAMAAIEKVRRIHRHVRGHDPVTDRDYAADDPDLLLWVHAAEVHSFLKAFNTYGPGLGPEDADRYLEEMAQVAVLLGANDDEVPRTVEALRSYLLEQELLATPAAKEAMRFILYPPVPWPEGRFPQIPGGRLAAIPGRAGWSVFSLATIALLPGRVRRAYRLPWVPVTPPLKASVFAVTRAMALLLPPPPGLREAIEKGKPFRRTESAA